MFSKLSKLAAIVTAVGILTATTVKVLSYEFVKKEELATCEIRVNKIENDMTRVDQKLTDIGSDVKEIKKVLIHR